LNIQLQKWLWNQYLPHSESKSYQIYSIKSYSSRSFQQYQRTFEFPPKFQLGFILIFSEEIIQYSRTFALQVQTPWNHAHAPLFVQSYILRTFMDDVRWNLRHHAGMNIFHISSYVCDAPPFSLWYKQLTLKFEYFIWCDTYRNLANILKPWLCLGVIALCFEVW
jgi:hypothetical protein